MTLAEMKALLQLRLHDPSGGRYGDIETERLLNAAQRVVAEEVDLQFLDNLILSVTKAGTAGVADAPTEDMAQRVRVEIGGKRAQKLRLIHKDRWSNDGSAHVRSANEPGYYFLDRQINYLPATNASVVIYYVSYPRTLGDGGGDEEATPTPAK